MALFALGRTIGWIVHAIEQNGDAELIRAAGALHRPHSNRGLKAIQPKSMAAGSRQHFAGKLRGVLGNRR
jgi:hypothetical protein